MLDRRQIIVSSAAALGVVATFGLPESSTSAMAAKTPEYVPWWLSFGPQRGFDEVQCFDLVNREWVPLSEEEALKSPFVGDAVVRDRLYRFWVCEDDQLQGAADGSFSEDQKAPTWRHHDFFEWHSRDDTGKITGTRWYPIFGLETWIS